MKVAAFFNLVFLPFLVSAVIITYDPIMVSNATLVKQVHYMFDNKTTPAVGEPGAGKNYIDLSFDVSMIDASQKTGRGSVELLVVDDYIYNHIGYPEKDVHYYCCDDVAYDRKECNEHNKLMMFNKTMGQYWKKDVVFTGINTTVSVRADITKEGKYWMVIGMCDPETKNMKLTGKAVVMNPYGHIPARVYGIIPFTKLVMGIYFVLTFIWMVRCFMYRKDLMSVHVMITVVLLIFLFDIVVKYINLVDYNNEGTYTRGLTIFSIIITSATHAVARCLTIMVAMGLGVSKASLVGSMWKIVAMGIIYFFFSLWDAMLTTFSTVSDVNLWRIIPASLIDSVIYFWILQSLLDTIQELQDKKQTGKLDVFLQLRNMIVVAVIISTVYNVVFSYLIYEKEVERLWKFQWFFNDGIWASFYLAVIASIMYLWAPNERSLAYAYHVQVATDERQDTEEYTMQEELQSAVGEGSVQVATVEAIEENLKPMAIKPNN